MKKFNADECFPGKGEYDYEIFGLDQDRALYLTTLLFTVLQGGMTKAIVKNKEYSILNAMNELFDIVEDLTLCEYGWLCYCTNKVTALVKTKVAEDKANSIINNNQERLDKDIMRGNNFNKKILGHE